MMKRAQRKVGKKAWQKMSVGEKEQLVRSMSSGSTPGQQGAVGGLSGKKTGVPADYQPNFGVCPPASNAQALLASQYEIV